MGQRDEILNSKSGLYMAESPTEMKGEMVMMEL
jgi:hypothetical protein